MLYKNYTTHHTHSSNDDLRCVNSRELTSIRVGLVEKLHACMQVSKGSDAKAVGRVKLRLQELTTNLTDIHQLKETGCRKQNL